MYLAIRITLFCSGGLVKAEQTAIATVPFLPNKTVANGYHGLQVMFSFEVNNYGVCRWRFDGQGSSLAVEFFASPSVECGDRADIAGNFLLLCTESSGSVHTTLLVKRSLQPFYVRTSVECSVELISAIDTLAFIHLTVSSKKDVFKWSYYVTVNNFNCIPTDFIFSAQAQ